MLLIDQDWQVINLLFHQFSHGFVWYRLEEINLIELYVWQRLLFCDRQAREDTNHVLDLGVWKLFLRSRALDVPWLIVQLVIDFRASYDDITQHVAVKFRVKPLLHHSHVFDLSHDAHHAKVEELVISVIHEVATFHVLVCDSQDTAAY